MKNILITGGNGQLAKTFKSLKPNYSSYNFIIKSKKELDITDLDSLKNEIFNNKYDFIFNCAAYTDVDRAEEKDDYNKSINYVAVKKMTELIQGTNCKLVQFSTDYVFDGNKKKEYLETDKANPINNYGNSKYLAEQHIINSSSKSLIIRTSWLFSEFNSNFVKKIIDLTKKKNQISVTDIEIGSPTYSYDLANFCMILCEENINWNGEIFNFSNSGYATRYELAKKIVDILKIDCQIIKSHDINSPKALRPQNSRLSLSKIKTKFNITPRFWEEALHECVIKIK